MIPKPRIEIILYTDGACRGNGKSTAIGGWGVYSEDIGLEICGGDSATTNNRMELTAAIKAVEHITKNRAIDNITADTTYIIRSDSNYVIKGVTEWMQGWVRKNWIDVKNPDLWKHLNAMIENNQSCTIQWEWVKGHSTSKGNQKADDLANLGCDGITMSNDTIQKYVSKEDFKKYITSDMVAINIGKQPDEVVDKVYDFFVSGKYSRKDNYFVDSAYMIFITMSYMQNKEFK